MIFTLFCESGFICQSLSDIYDRARCKLRVGLGLIYTSCFARALLDSNQLLSHEFRKLHHFAHV